MKLHRIFIAINVPDEAKEELLAYQNKWPEIPARWTTKDNLHITLAFLGNTSDQELAEVCELLQQVGERRKPFRVELTRITYGPPGKAPRMIWAHIETSAELLGLQKDVEKTVGLPTETSAKAEQGSNPPISLKTGKNFSPHLTLARLKTFELQRMELEEIPEINEDIFIPVDVASIEVVESTLKRGGPQYNILQSVPFSQKPQ